MGMLMIEKDFIIRDEKNGATVYEKIPHLFTFYQGLSTDIIKQDVNPLTSGNFRSYISGQAERITKDVQSEYPFYIGWEVSGACNLDCIYCFSENKIHTKNTDDIMDTANHILSLNPISVGLSGGEPTLNPKLPDIMRLFHGKVAMILNTNGTTEQIESLIPLLKETNTLVRLTIDTLDNKLLNQLRPPRNKDMNYDQVGDLKKNTSMLIEAGVHFMIHTVLTQKNIGSLEMTAEELIKLGVNRWHFYPVDYSKKCKDFYDDIKVSPEQVSTTCETLISKYGDKIRITYPRHIRDRKNAILLVDSTGRFMLDSSSGDPVFIGNDPKHPSYSEIMSVFKYETHKACYLTNYWE